MEKCFKSNAGEDNPDIEAVREVQKAMVNFVKNTVEKAAERSTSRQENKKLLIEDVLYQMRHESKYMDACAKYMLYQVYTKDARKKEDVKNVAKQDLDLNEDLSKYDEVDFQDIENQDEISEG